MSPENKKEHYTDDDVKNMIESELLETMAYFYDKDSEPEEVFLGGDKIDEYVFRIKHGETLESFGDIPLSWKSMIEERLVAEKPQGKIDLSGYPMIPTKYESLVNDPDLLDEMWDIPIYADESKNRQLLAWKERGLEFARSMKEKGEFDTKREVQSSDFSEKRGLEKNTPKINIEANKKLYGWVASYELAKIAKEEGVDLSKLSREDYADYAIKNYLAIDDDQLRAHPLQRNCTSVADVLVMAKQEEASLDMEIEKRFARFSAEMKILASKPQRERFLLGSSDVRVASSTADSNSWLFFTINKGMDNESKEAHKSYFSFSDLNKLTPEKFVKFMIFLQDNGYNGSVKIFQDMEFQGTRLNDQVVMHGQTETDSKLALDLANKYFGEDIGTTSFGKDEEIDGKNLSYSQILAKKIADRVRNG